MKQIGIARIVPMVMASTLVFGMSGGAGKEEVEIG
jgi:hypothetical protein